MNVLPESNPKPEIQNPKPEMMGYEKPDPIPECSNPTRPETREKSTRSCPTFQQTVKSLLTVTKKVFYAILSSFSSEKSSKV